MTDPIHTELVKISEANGVMEIVWNRPDKKNALSNAMYRAATAALARASEDKSIRVVLIASEGDSFTSGNDLADFAAAATGGEAPAAHAFIETLIQFPKPIVAAVSGLAVGVGTTMLLHCDLVFAAIDAKLTTPFVNLALVPEAASSLLLPARIGHARAFAMFAMGDAVTGAQAAQLGLANAALPKEEVLAAAREAAAKLAQRPIGAVMAAKKLMRDGERLLAQSRTEGAIFAERMRSAEAMEAFTAFREKRAPDFSKL
ncbi:MAG: enoyl-CoA hydratase/isomerase family protein [Hyphomonadaceae bacterium]|jgi:enoyl-CoA hydratase/carnithine racemase|nr:enoyl-CoA hydratase/isomerase family protein [Hyphomonadaceae bacterium]